MTIGFVFIVIIFHDGRPFSSEAIKEACKDTLILDPVCVRTEGKVKGHKRREKEEQMKGGGSCGSVGTGFTGPH